MNLLLQLLVNGVVQAGLFAPIALGFAFIFGIVRIFHFAHGGVIVGASYATWYVMQVRGMGLLEALVAASVAAVALGLLVELAVYRPLRARGTTNLMVFIASLGVLILMESMFALAFGSQPLVVENQPWRGGIELGSARATYLQVFAVVVGLLSLVLVVAFLRLTSFGRAMRAVGENLEASVVIGLNTNRVYLVTIILGSLLAAPVGALLTLQIGVTPTVSKDVLFFSAISVIVGGIGSIPGAAAGVLLLGLAQNVGIWQLPSGWQSSIVYAILLAVVLLRPHGLMGKMTFKEEA